MQHDGDLSRAWISFGPFRLFAGERLLEKEGQPLKLGSRAMDILVLLLEQAGDVVSKSELIARAWPDLTVEEGSLRFHVAALRKVLGDGLNGARYVTNVPGRGYCFVAPISVSTASSPDLAAPGQFQPQDLPSALPRLIGRDEIVQSISRQLTDNRFVTIRGPGGIGKTTVAVALAHAKQDAFEGGVVFLDLAPLTDASFASGALASVLGLLVQSDDPTASIVKILRGRRILLIFDNCEHVVEGAAALAECIYREAPSVSILATSREALRAEGEHLFELSALEAPPDSDDLKAAQVLGFPATQLFAERATAAGFRGELTDAEAKIIAEICRKLDGIALAIELAASRAGSHGVGETASLLDGYFKLLWRGRRTAPSRQQTLKATLDWSYNQTDERERTALRRLSIFMGRFTLDAARAIVSDDRFDSAEVVETLEQLVAKSLVSATYNETETRYRLLDTTRAYAYAKLIESGEAREIAQRHAMYAADHLLCPASGVVGGLQGRAASSEQIGDVRAALAWSFSEMGDAALAIRLTAAAAHLFTKFSLLNDCRRWTEQALAAEDESACAHRTTMELNAALGHALMFTEGNGEQARAALETALKLAEQIGDRHSEFRLLARLHMYHRRTGKISRLFPIALRYQALARELDDPVAVSAAHTLLSVTHHLKGDQAAARAHLDETLRMGVFRSVKPDHFAFHRSPYIALPRCLWLQGFPDQAIETARSVMDVEVPADAATHCIALIWQAAVFRWVGDWTTVETLTTRLLTHSERHSLRPYHNVGVALQGESMIKTGQIDGGVNLLQDAIASLRADDYGLYTFELSGSLALGLAAQGRLDEAWNLIDGTLAVLTTDGENFELPELLRIRGEIQSRQGQEAAAESSYRASAALAVQHGALSWRLRADTSLARLLCARGHRHEAREVLAATYDRFDEGYATPDLISAKRVLEKLGEPGPEMAG